MNPIILDWLGLFLRWTHVMLGIGWIGTSFFFVWLDASLRANPAAPKDLAGDSWMVHGGGFYHAQKYLVAPETLPKELHWFKYEAYLTWVSGFLLLGLVYYLGAKEFLIDPAIMELAPSQAIGFSIASLVAGWLIYDALCRSPLIRHTGALATMVFLLAVIAAYTYTHVFSGRAAFIHIGAFLGTIMAANVFLVIIPNQRKVVADLLAGRAPDPALGQQAKQRSLHNNYLTLPVVLTMVSNHYPMLYDPAISWIYAVGIIVIGGLLRLYANATHAGRGGNRIDWLLVYAAGVVVALVMFSIEISSRNGAALTAGPPASLAEVVPIIQNRCVSCHSASPSDAGFRTPPKGIIFDTPEQIETYASQILRVTVRSTAMPLGNRTGMMPEERAILGRWATSVD
ncbi:MAG: urate hydroxylase PuuD [Dongiaceae bacterium]